MNDKIIKVLKKLPDCPGVYYFYRGGEILYIGKAINLKKRVSSYFQKAHDLRIGQMVAQATDIKFTETPTNIEALILESNLVQEYQPPYNVKLKDNKTFLGVYITDEDFPRVFPARVTQSLPKGEWFGPYTSAYQLRSALKIIRRIFPWCDDPDNQKQKPCFYFHIGLCSGACTDQISRKDYGRIIQHLKLFLKGQKKKLIGLTKKSMAVAAKNQEFEEALRLKKQLIALEHIQDTALAMSGDEESDPAGKKLKIECFDIANIGNDSIVGAMVAFVGNQADKNQYRKFKIKRQLKQNDVASIAEIVDRRLNHSEWQPADLLLIDGGVGQVNAVKQILFDRKISYLPVVGLAKGPKRNKTELIGDVSFVVQNKIPLKTLVKARDEAHRFARNYYFYLRKKKMLNIIK